jgi:hypothetical protein
MKVCGPVARIAMPVVQAAIPRCKRINTFLGGQLPSLVAVGFASTFYLYFIA